MSRCPFQWEQNLQRFSCEVSWSQVPVWWISEWLLWWKWGRYWCPTGDTSALDGPDVCPRPTIYQRGAVRVAWSQEKRNWVPGDVESLEETSRMCHVPHVPHVLRTFNSRIDKSIKNHMALLCFIGYDWFCQCSIPQDFAVETCLHQDLSESTSQTYDKHHTVQICTSFFSFFELENLAPRLKLIVVASPCSSSRRLKGMQLATSGSNGIGWIQRIWTDPSNSLHQFTGLPNTLIQDQDKQNNSYHLIIISALREPMYISRLYVYHNLHWNHWTHGHTYFRTEILEYFESLQEWPIVPDEGGCGAWQCTVLSFNVL